MKRTRVKREWGGGGWKNTSGERRRGFRVKRERVGQERRTGPEKRERQGREYEGVEIKRGRRSNERGPKRRRWGEKERVDRN